MGHPADRQERARSARPPQVRLDDIDGVTLQKAGKIGWGVEIFTGCNCKAPRVTRVRRTGRTRSGRRNRV